MTPLARKVMNYTSGNVADKLVTAVCFECSDIYESAYHLWPSLPAVKENSWRGIKESLGAHMDEAKAIAGSLFLPFPVTWLEYKTPQGRRGVVLESVGNDVMATFSADVSGTVIFFDPILVDLGDRHNIDAFANELVMAVCKQEKQALVCYEMRRVIYGLLAIINTPRATNKQTNTPHRGFEKNLKSKYGRPIKLNDWHVVTLRAPKEIEDAVNGGATGVVRALHRCRAHRRKLPSGKSTIVVSHLRGDPSKGFSPSTYRVLH